jgi:cytochrome c-type biogenesis protein CcmF
VDAAWGRWVRPWTLAAWVFLTIGIALGSWWAYYELGWGGFWFWDPVENASFMPWLFACALLHSAIVVEKREALKSWTILLAILAFGFSLIGAFIVRSGVLTSVHAFANDPERGVFILFILAAFMGGALTLYAARAGAVMQARGVFSSLSRESALILNNVILAVSAFVVFVGTVWPLVAEMLWGQKLSVGAPFFNMAFTPFMLVLAIVLPLGALIPWKRAPQAGRMWGLLAPALVLAVAVGSLAFALQTGRSALGPVGLALGVWLLAGAFVDLWQRAARGGPFARLGRMVRLPRADLGRAVAHGGFGVTMIGIAAMTAWQTEDIRVTTIDAPYEVAGYTITLERVADLDGPNYRTTMAQMRFERPGYAPITLLPEKRFYPVAAMPTTEAAIDNGIWRDLYAVIGDRQADGGWAVRVYVKPLANWIWLGALMMAIGGGLSLSDRRMRLAAGAAKSPKPNLAVPAE